MKTALVAIAKDEDLYIQEWIDYHFKLGFDDIVIFQNNWRCKDKDPRVRWFELDGDCKQLEAYNKALDMDSTYYDWMAFFDIDEFLCLKRDLSLEMFLSRYDDIYSVCVNWRLFGDNGLQTFDPSNTSCLKRFTRCQRVLNKHVKTIVHTGLCQNVLRFINPHCTHGSLWGEVACSTAKTHYVHGPYNEGTKHEIAQLNHYFLKTKQEWQQKVARGRADVPSGDVLHTRPDCEFDQHNFNEVEDLTALKFMEKHNM